MLPEDSVLAFKRWCSTGRTVLRTRPALGLAGCLEYGRAAFLGLDLAERPGDVVLLQTPVAAELAHLLPGQVGQFEIGEFGGQLDGQSGGRDRQTRLSQMRL